MAKLNEKQKKFCKEYVLDFNATQAAIRAGYSKKTASVIGYENLRKPQIQEYFKKLMKKPLEKADVSIDNVLNYAVEIRSRCMTEEPVMVKTSEGMEESGEWKFDASNALKANEQLGKYLKMFTDKVEVDSNQEVTINFNIPRPKKPKKDIK